MYTLKEFTYPEAGYYLMGEKARGFGVPTSFGPFTEREIDLSNLTVTDEFITFDTVRWANPGILSYADAKEYIIKKRYSNDAQIAIMLNKENSAEDELAYDKMQDWRDWASTVAHKIMEQIEQPNTNQ